MLRHDKYITYALVTIFIYFKYCNCSETDDELNTFVSELNIYTEKVDQDYFPKDKDVLFIEATRSCAACIWLTCKNLENRINMLINKRNEIRNQNNIPVDQEIDSQLIDETKFGSLQIFTKVYSVILTDQIKWRHSCKFNFPTKFYMSSYKTGDTNIIPHCELLKNPADLTEGGSDEKIKKCFKTYISDTVDSQVVNEFAEMFTNYKTEVDGLLTNSGLTASQQNCYGCLQLALTDQVNAIPSDTGSGYPVDESADFVRNGYAFKKHFDEFKKKCSNGIPAEPITVKNDFETRFEKYKNQWLVKGGYTYLKECVDYYVTETDEKLKSYVTKINTYIEEIENEYFVKDALYTDATLSCMACIRLTIMNFKNRIQNLVDKRNEIRSQNNIPFDQEIDSELIDDKQFGSLNIFTDVNSIFINNWETWKNSCVNKFPTKNSMDSYKTTGDIDMIPNCELFKNPQDLTQGGSDEKIKNCFQTYISDTVDRVVVNEFATMLTNYKTVVDGLLSTSGLTPTKQNCYGCLQSALTNEVNAIPTATESFDKSVSFASNGYAIKTFFDKYKNKCSNGLPAQSTTENDDYKTRFADYQNKWLISGNYYNFKQCMDHYVTWTNEELNTYSTDLNSHKKALEEHILFQEELLIDAQRSCYACIRLTIMNLINRINKLFNKRNEIRNQNNTPDGQEIDSKLIDEKQLGSLQIFKAVFSITKTNILPWQDYCDKEFPNKNSMTSYETGDSNIISYCELFKNPQDLTEGGSDEKIKSCLKSYIGDTVDNNALNEFAEMFNNYKTEVDGLLTNPELAPSQQNCYGCLQLALTDAVEAIQEDTQTYSHEEAVDLIKNGYAVRKHFNEFKSKCRNGIPTNTKVIEIDNYKTTYADYKGLWLTQGDYSNLKSCIDYYV